MTAEEQSELRAFFDDESKLSDMEVDARDDRWAESSAARRSAKTLGATNFGGLFDGEKANVAPRFRGAHGGSGR